MQSVLCVHVFLSGVQESRARLQAAQVRLTEAERAAAEAAEHAERMDVDAEKAVSDQVSFSTSCLLAMCAALPVSLSMQ